jgi:hypothetical protein
MRVAILSLTFLAGCATSQERMRAQATDPPAAGMAVLDPAGVISDPLAPVVEDALAWWCFRFPDRAEALRAFLAGGVLNVVAQDHPMVHMENPKPAVGLSRDNNVAIWWDTRDAGALFVPWLRHELGHVMLNALHLARTEAEDHAVFARLGWNW